ncbi:unnamed protein product [Spirodela intermedia]|uniref:Uncharacterized protein n=1 Tax=Spirodela intermedia TaxID=51605 RepID=A0A7I8JCF1_SPIIN|nr:unnamed protein product [Spirodela intermedia]CAA6667868.1 unnamed protein product [Spirodela intermedia]
MASPLLRLSRKGLRSLLGPNLVSFLCGICLRNRRRRRGFFLRSGEVGLQGPEEDHSLGQWLPKIAVDAYVAPNVVLAGQVTVYDGASVWNGSVLRGDLNKITVGFCSNVQERCVLHAAWTSPTGLPAETLIERYVTVGAGSLLRSCSVEPECIIGQRSILMEGSLVETNAILEAGTVVPPGAASLRRALGGESGEVREEADSRGDPGDPKLAVAINDLMQSHFSEFLPYSTVYLEVEKLKKALGIPSE